MTEEEREHRLKMIDHARKIMRTQEQDRQKPLTAEELAEAIRDLKRKYPKEFPPSA